MEKEKTDLVKHLETNGSFSVNFITEILIENPLKDLLVCVLYQYGTIKKGGWKWNCNFYKNGELIDSVSESADKIEGEIQKVLKDCEFYVVSRESKIITSSKKVVESKVVINHLTSILGEIKNVYGIHELIGGLAKKYHSM